MSKKGNNKTRQMENFSNRNAGYSLKRKLNNQWNSAVIFENKYI